MPRREALAGSRSKANVGPTVVQAIRGTSEPRGAAHWKGILLREAIWPRWRCETDATVVLHVRPRRIVPAATGLLGEVLFVRGSAVMFEAFSVPGEINQRGCGGAPRDVVAARIGPGFLFFELGLVVWLVGSLRASWVSMPTARTAQAR